MFSFKSNPIVSILIVILFSILLSSCGGDKFILKPKNIKSFYPQRTNYLDSVKILDVIDSRSKPSDTLGSSYVGIWNKKVPCILSVSTKNYIKTSLSELIESNNKSSQYVPVTVFIDTLQLGEKTGMISEVAYCNYSFRFSYPINENDTRILSVTNNLMQPTSMDATDLVGSQLYKAVYESAEKFIDYYKANPYRKTGVIKTSADKTATPSLGTAPSETKIYKDTIVSKSDTRTRSAFSLTYYQGKKIQSGYQACYHEVFNKHNTQFEYGAGYAITILNIKYDQINGSFFSFNVPINARYYFSKELTGVFLNGTMKLTGGSETIEYSNGYNSKNKTNYFFGPTFEESIGINLTQGFGINAGLFQLFHWGSDILPSDFGFMVSISFGKSYK